MTLLYLIVNTWHKIDKVFCHRGEVLINLADRYGAEVKLLFWDLLVTYDLSVFTTWIYSFCLINFTRHMLRLACVNRSF